MASRSVHVVRIKDPGNPQNWIDIKVVDKIAYHGPNGVEYLLDTTAKNANPFIKDDTGDNNGKGDAGSCSRSSHMVKLSQGGMKFDAEYLDAVVFKGPNGDERLLYCPEKEAHAAVTDNTDGNLEVPPDESTTRQCHIVKVKDESNTSQAIYVERVDSICYDGPNGQENLLFNPGDGDETDTTKYGDNQTPPDNADPNIYVAWGASGSSSGSAGPWVGASNPVKMGPLWWIVKANGGETLLLLIEVFTTGTGTPNDVVLKGLPFLPVQGASMTLDDTGVLFFTDGSTGAGSIAITDQPTQDMLDHLYLWSTPTQIQFIVPPFPGLAGAQEWTSDNFIILNLSAITRDFPILLDGASGASGASGSSGATTWNAKFTINVPDLAGNPPVSNDEQFYIVWQQTNPAVTDPYDIADNGGVAPPWIAVYYPDQPTYPTMTNAEIADMVQGLPPPPGIPDALPVHLFGDLTEADSLATYMTDLSGSQFIDTGYTQTGGDSAGGSATSTVKVGVFKNPFLLGASGQPPYGFDFAGELPGPFASQNFLNNEFFQWWYNGATGATGIPDPFTPPTHSPSIQPDYPPNQTYFPAGSTGSSGQTGGTGIGPVSAQTYGTSGPAGGAESAYTATVFIDFQGATGATGATGAFVASPVITMTTV